MKILKILSAACLCSALIAAGTRAASAGNREATASPTPAASPTATASPSQSALFAGHVWVNAHVVGDREVMAKIGDTVCAIASPPFIVPPPGPDPVYSLSVPSQEVVPGCGYEGAVVRFFVAGQEVPQTAIWHAGLFQGLALIIGPPFSYFSAGGPGQEEVVRAGGRLVPYIGDTVCGYGGIVYSSGQEPGCGVEGSVVTFKLLDARGNVVAVANQTGVWHAWDGISDPQRLDLTFGPATIITMPGTGDAPGRRCHWCWGWPA